MLADADVVVAGGGPAGLGAAIGGGASRRPGRALRALRVPGWEPHRRCRRHHLRSLRGRRVEVFDFVVGRVAARSPSGSRPNGTGAGPVPFKETAVFLYVPWPAKRLADHLVEEAGPIDLLLHALVADVARRRRPDPRAGARDQTGPRRSQARCSSTAPATPTSRRSRACRPSSGRPAAASTRRCSSSCSTSTRPGRWRRVGGLSELIAEHGAPSHRDGGAVIPTFRPGEFVGAMTRGAQPRRLAHRRHRRAPGDLGRARRSAAGRGGRRVPAGTRPGFGEAFLADTATAPRRARDPPRRRRATCSPETTCAGGARVRRRRRARARGRRSTTSAVGRPSTASCRRASATRCRTAACNRGACPTSSSPGAACRPTTTLSPSTRVMGPSLALGQAAGTAAFLAARDGADVADVDVDELQTPPGQAGGIALNLAELLLAPATDRPDAVALHHDGTGRRTGSWPRPPARFAGHLARQGVDAGRPGRDRGINHPGSPPPTWARLRAGSVVVPLNPQAPEAELERELGAVEAKVVLREGDLRSGPDGDAGPVVERDDDDLAVLLFTAGTAGTPKAAMLTHGNLAANVAPGAATTPASRFRPDDVALGVLPFFHVFGLNAVLGVALAAGASSSCSTSSTPPASLPVVRGPRRDRARRRPGDVRRLARAARVRSACRRVLVRPAGGLGCRRAPGGGGRGFRERFGVAIHEGYGLTEAAPIVTTSAISAHRASAGSIGPPLPGVEVRLVDVDGADVLAGDPGEIWVRGPNVFPGYWRDDEATGRRAHRRRLAAHRRRRGDRRRRRSQPGRPVEGPGHRVRVQRVPGRGRGGAARLTPTSPRRRWSASPPAHRRGGVAFVVAEPGRAPDRRHAHGTLRALAGPLQVPPHTSRWSTRCPAPSPARCSAGSCVPRGGERAQSSSGRL